MNIDDLTAKTTNPTVLNALHACRDNHPIGRYKTRYENFVNAAFLAMQDAAFTKSDVDWLRHQAGPSDSGCYFTADGTLMNADGTRSIFDDVDQ